MKMIILPSPRDYDVCSSHLSLFKRILFAYSLGIKKSNSQIVPSVKIDLKICECTDEEKLIQLFANS